MTPSLSLLPIPRHLEPCRGANPLPPDRLIRLECPSPQYLFFSASKLQQFLRTHLGLHWQINASSSAPTDRSGITLRLAPAEVTHPQGYKLTITHQEMLIQAHDEAGIFYGVCTLIQIIDSTSIARQSSLPCLHIEDWPDFPARGVMLDVSRDKVPSMQTLLDLVDRLAGWKINQLQLYIEHTFAYQNHPEVWQHASPFTAEEIMRLDAYCQERFIELVPNQNSFGHMHRWLEHPRYRHLAEAPEGFDYPWGKHSDNPFSLCPLDPGSLELVTSLYDELLPHFSSRKFNVGCDETFDLGQGRSQAACEQFGPGRVYLDFLQKIYHEVTRRGHSMQFWGDIIIHHPDLVPELPRDLTALEWGYEADHPFSDHGAQFARAGLPFYVCPGTSAWTSIAGRTHNALGNLLNAAENGLKNGAVGYLNTDWGDEGHWQTLPVSYLGFVAGAADSWALEANRDMDISHTLSLYAFDDPSGNMGQVAYDLGNVYRAVGVEPSNSSTLFWLLHQPLSLATDYGGLAPASSLYHTLEVIDQTARPLKVSQSSRADIHLLNQEFDLTLHMLRHACQRGLFALHEAGVSASWLDKDLLELIDEYKLVWLSRNRPGGLKDSLAGLERSRKDYHTHA